MFTRPTTVKGLQQFAGMVNYDHRFIPRTADIMHPIHVPLAGKPVDLEWSNDLEESFSSKKLVLCTLCAYTAHHRVARTS